MHYKHYNTHTTSQHIVSLSLSLSLYSSSPNQPLQKLVHLPKMAALMEGRRQSATANLKRLGFKTNCTSQPDAAHPSTASCRLPLTREYAFAACAILASSLLSAPPDYELRAAVASAKDGDQLAPGQHFQGLRSIP